MCASLTASLSIRRRPCFQDTRLCEDDNWPSISGDARPRVGSFAFFSRVANSSEVSHFYPVSQTANMPGSGSPGSTLLSSGSSWSGPHRVAARRAGLPHAGQLGLSRPLLNVPRMDCFSPFCSVRPGQTHEISVAGPSLLNDDVPSRLRGEDHVHRKPGSAFQCC